MKRLLPVFITFCLLILCNLQHSNLYAQDPELFEHTWYFANGELNGEEFYPTVNLTADLYFYPNDILIGYTYCEGGISFENILYEEGNFFEILGSSIVLIDHCGPEQENELIFMNKHNSIYVDFQNSGAAINPFSYNIEPIDNYYQLTIENGASEWAVYNSVYLSINDFFKDSFTLYPNPVKETLNINNHSNQQVSAIIYDLNGKLMKSYSIENNATALNVKSLDQGLYFIVFENETGERVSKKFVKR